jgi:diguanylate cyclase
MPGQPRPRRERTVIDVEARPLLLLLATLVSLLTAGVLAHALRTARSRDSLMGWGWVLGGAVAVGTGLWSTQALALLGSRLGGTQLFAFKSIALAWSASVAAAAVGLLAARSLTSRRLRIWVTPWLLSLIFGVALAVTVRVLPSVSELATWSLGGALAAVGLLAASATFSQWWTHTATGQAREDLGPHAAVSITVLGIGLAGAHALALRSIQYRPLGSGVLPGGGLDALGLTVSASVGALAVAIAVLGAWFDWRNRAQNRTLATSLNEANIQLRRQAFCDPLTALPNRLLFEERLNQTLQRVGRTPSAMAVLFIDLDGFKPINDAHGHDIGDQVLRIVAARLSRSVRSDDMVGRLGGDEFACLLSNLPSREQLCHLACKLVDAVAAPIQLGGLELTVRPSIGIATCPADGVTAPELLRNADAAMYRAKRSGSGYAFHGA